LTTSTQRTGRVTKAKIAQAALRLVGQYGVTGTSTARIAAAVGVSEAALYRHFKSRHEMIVAALDALYSLISAIQSAGTAENAVERLREISQAHVAYSSSHREDLVAPFLGFVASPVSDGFRERLEIRQQAATAVLANIVEEGKAQGTVRKDVDSEQVAWELVAAYWADVVAHGVGLRQFADQERTARMLDFILDGISEQSARRTSEVPTAARQ
jgi:AcrR family transcriptional regulator